jgi:hypothetical protein
MRSAFFGILAHAVVGITPVGASSAAGIEIGCRNLTVAVLYSVSESYKAVDDYIRSPDRGLFDVLSVIYASRGRIGDGSTPSYIEMYAHEGDFFLVKIEYDEKQVASENEPRRVDISNDPGDTARNVLCKALHKNCVDSEKAREVPLLSSGSGRGVCEVRFGTFPSHLTKVRYGLAVSERSINKKNILWSSPEALGKIFDRLP